MNRCVHRAPTAVHERALVLREPVVVEARYVRQTSGPGAFAIGTLRFEPAESLQSLGLVLAPDRKLQLVALTWDACLDALMRGLLAVAEAEPTVFVAGMRVTIIALRDHPIDSRSHCFEQLGRVALTEALQRAARPAALCWQVELEAAPALEDRLARQLAALEGHVLRRARHTDRLSLAWQVPWTHGDALRAALAQLTPDIAAAPPRPGLG